MHTQPQENTKAYATLKKAFKLCVEVFSHTLLT